MSNYRTDGRTLQLELSFKRARTALLWAIADRKPEKAEKHAITVARSLRLLQARQEKLGYEVLGR